MGGNDQWFCSLRIKKNILRVDGRVLSFNVDSFNGSSSKLDSSFIAITKIDANINNLVITKVDGA